VLRFVEGMRVDFRCALAMCNERGRSAKFYLAATRTEGYPMAEVVDVRALPAFSNTRARCSRCGAWREIRVHFDRDCKVVHGGDHFHRLCRCGNEWIERTTEGTAVAPMS
jgi:hypothetical protein